MSEPLSPAALAGNESQILPGRACGECALCCKVFRVPELDKPANKWCVHCKPGMNACQIYETRPPVCRGYLCQYLTLKGLGEEWYPLHSKMVVSREENGKKVAIYVDPAFPRRWREEPYYSQIRRMSVLAAPQLIQVVVYVGTKGTVILPNKEVEVGPEDMVMLYEVSGLGRNWDVKVVKKQDLPPGDREEQAAALARSMSA
jgi:hypothetical protein